MRLGNIFFLISILLTGCLSYGCTTVPQSGPWGGTHGWAIDGVCRHQAIFAAIVFGDFYPVRVAVGPGRNAWHAQAEAYIQGEWRWLMKSGNAVQVGKRDVFTPIYHLTLDKAWEMLISNEGKLSEER